MIKYFLKHKLLNLLAIVLLSAAFYNTAYAMPSCIKAFDELSKSEQKTLQTEKTKFGVTLDHILKSGRENPDSKMGCYAGDAESYSMFSPIFNPVIKGYHKYDPSTSSNNKSVKFKFSDSDYAALSPRVKSTRIRVARNLSAFPFPSSMTKEQRIQVETKVLNAIKKLPEQYQGQYYSLGKLSKEEYENMVEKHLLFKDPTQDKYLKSAGISDDWPTGRGAYISDNKNFMVWLNEEDHLRIIYLAKNAKMDEIYKKFSHVLNILDNDLTFAYDKKLGYLNSCPTNLGTAMRASFHMTFNNLKESTLKSSAKKLGLAVRGTGGEHTETIGGVYDISNATRMGTKEALLNNLVTGTVALIKQDK